MKSQGEAIRYNEEFKKEGINVNFVEIKDDSLIVATYERGVEDETLSCGTGVTAAALAYFLKVKKVMGHHTIAVETKGGSLKVDFQANSENEFEDIWLNGRADKVFSGVFFNPE